MNPKYSKFYTAILTSLVLAGTLVSDGHLSLQDVIAILISFAGAYGVYAVPNKLSKP